MRLVNLNGSGLEVKLLATAFPIEEILPIESHMLEIIKLMIAKSN